MASDGFLFTHAYANAPVCAPARNTIITGIYANSAGNQHMRSRYAKSELVRTYPKFLREAGYYCTNNSKTDYNTSSIDPNSIWDESSGGAHYKNREPGQPFFAVFNTNISHKSSIHDYIPNEQLCHNPEEVPLPPSIRYWGASGLLILVEKAAPAKENLLDALADESANVVTVAAEALYNLVENPVYAEVENKLKEALMQELTKSEDPRVLGPDKEIFDSYIRYRGPMRRFPEPERLN